MLFLKFQIGTDGYLLDTAQIAEVLPLVEFKRIAHAPAAVAGLFNYRGVAVPAIDLTELALARPAARLLSTRLIVVPYRSEQDTEVGVTQNGHPHWLGLIAEKATETVQREAQEFDAPSAVSEAAPWSGAVTRDEHRLLQCIDVQRLLPEAIRRMLYPASRQTNPIDAGGVPA